MLKQRSSNRQQYALPLISADHRQRPIPLYLHPRRVERLVHYPELFKPSVVTPTNSNTHDKLIFDRLNKANGYNVGRGPVWELMEDVSWWNNSRPAVEGEVETEALRRPKVYDSIELGADWKILTQS